MTAGTRSGWILRELGMSEDIEQIFSQDGRYNVEIPIAMRERIGSEGSYQGSVQLSDDRMSDIRREDL
jgi:hypothetical protein